MAPLPPVANVFKVTLKFTLNGKPTQGIRMFFRWSGSPFTLAVATHFAQFVRTAFVGAGILGVIAVGNVLESATVQDLTTDMGVEFELPINTAGTRTGLPLPVDTAFLTSYEIGRHYRGGHPRSYWPFGVETDLTSPNKWKVASVSAFETVVIAAIGTLVGKFFAGCTIGNHVSISYYRGFTVVTNPVTGRARNVPDKRTPALSTTVTSVVGRQEVASFRRRRIATP